MSKPFAPGVGVVFSADIAVPEHEREVRFYSRILTTGEKPLWRDDLMNNLGLPIIGLGAESEEYRDLPLQWMPHIQVADVGTAAGRAVELGGTELMHARAEDGTSQWAVLLDPNGAAFGLIPVISPDMMPATDESSSDDREPIGRIAWLDLTTADADAARNFYREVVGWSVEDVPMADGEERYADYNMLGADDSPNAGVCHARGNNADMPPVWLLYLPVGDLAESLRRVEEEGGTVIRTSIGEDGAPSYAVIRDPVGAYIALTAE